MVSYLCVGVQRAAGVARREQPLPADGRPAAEGGGRGGGRPGDAAHARPPRPPRHLLARPAQVRGRAQPRALDVGGGRERLRRRQLVAVGAPHARDHRWVRQPFIQLETK